MNILFLTMGRFEGIETHSIYADLMRCFRNHGHDIYTISPNEKRTGKNTELIREKKANVLHVKTGNVTGASGIIEKGIAQISIESIYINAIKKYFDNVKFDLVIYSTPPITFCKVVEFIKKRDNAKSYLLLKDIFPQNAVDIGMMKTTGLKGLLYKYFRNQEKKLYALSDYIGCMSQANIDYLIEHNHEIDANKVQICPNSIDVVDKSVDVDTRNIIRSRYNIPLDKTVLVYGGNLGKPQGIPYLINCIKRCVNIESVFFLIVGNGSEYGLIEQYIQNSNSKNLKLLNRLPKEDYDTLVASCDVGMIFLDPRFTIPNFPSRLLGYLQAKLPVLAATDPNTDIGRVIVEGQFGWWCESNKENDFIEIINNYLMLNNNSINNLKESAFSYLQENYSSTISYNIIMSNFN